MLDKLKTLRCTWCTNITDNSLVQLVDLVSLSEFEAFGYVMGDNCQNKFKDVGVTLQFGDTIIGDRLIPQHS